MLMVSFPLDDVFSLLAFAEDESPLGPEVNKPEKNNTSFKLKTKTHGFNVNINQLLKNVS